MGDIDFVERLREAFEDSRFRRPSPLRRLSFARSEQLAGHRKWVRSEGRFGSQAIWKNVTQAFCEANHAAEDFSHVEFVNCVFEWSDLRCASFAKAKLIDVQFKNCDLENCDFTEALLQGVSFTDCFDFDKANFADAVFLSAAKDSRKPGRNPTADPD